jgi:hypothetical protein
MQRTRRASASNCPQIPAEPGSARGAPPVSWIRLEDDPRTSPPDRGPPSSPPTYPATGGALPRRRARSARCPRCSSRSWPISVSNGSCLPATTAAAAAPTALPGLARARRATCGAGNRPDRRHVAARGQGVRTRTPPCSRDGIIRAARMPAWDDPERKGGSLWR